VLHSGLNFRKLQKRNQFSFESSFLLNAVSGSGLFGFSGEGQDFSFKFVSGKIFDPENRYFNSYSDDSVFLISGNVSGSSYDYYFNNDLYCKKGVKNNFNFENFYLNTSPGVTIDLNLKINANGDGDFAVSGMPALFEMGNPFSGKIVETGAGGNFTIFSGVLNSPVFPSGGLSITNFPIQVNGTGDIIFSGGGADLEFGKNYLFDIDFYTSFGKKNKQFFITGDTTIRSYFFDLGVSKEWSLVNLSGSPISGGNFNSSRTGEYFISQNYYVNSVAQTGLAQFAKLSYSSGVTGEISGIVTGSFLTNYGSGYFTDALIFVSGIGGIGGGATAKGVVDLFGHVTGLALSSAGSGYVQNPAFIIRSNAAELIITNSGAGYFSAPNFLISGLDGFPSSGQMGINATLGKLSGFPVFDNYGSGFITLPTATIYSVLSGLTLSSSGAGYTGDVGLTFSGGGGSGISAFGLIDYRVKRIDITNAGNAYTSAPSVIFNGQEIQAASGIALLSNGFITGVNITSQGKYRQTPTVIFSGGSPSITGLGTAITTGAITGSLIENRGNNYVGTPTVLTSSISGSGGAFVATISSGASANVILSTGASGSGIIGQYTKSFTGSFNLLTGTGSSFVDFRAGNLTSIDNLTYEDQIIYLNNTEGIDVGVVYSGYYDDFPMVALLTVSGSGGNLDTRLITGIR